MILPCIGVHWASLKQVPKTQVKLAEAHMELLCYQKSINIASGMAGSRNSRLLSLGSAFFAWALLLMVPLWDGRESLG